MKSYKSSDLFRIPSRDEAERRESMSFVPRTRQNYTKAIILGLVFGIVIGGAIGIGVAYATRSKRS